MRQQLEHQHRVRGRHVALAGVLAAAAGCMSEPGERTARELGQAEMEAVHGGVAADITFPASNSFQTFDNLRFTASVGADGGTGSAILGVFAGATKVGEQTVELPGIWDRRTRWPLNGLSSAQFKVVFNGEWFDASGDSLRTKIRLHEDVKVYGVHLRSVTAGANSTTINARMIEDIDSPNPATPIRTGNSIDGIFGQCGGTDKTQWRHIDSEAIVTTAACADMATITDNCPPATCGNQDFEQCPALMHCLRNVYGEEALETEDVYVFHVKSIPCGRIGQNIGLDVPERRNMVFITHDASTAPTQYTSLLAHELGHGFHAAHCESNTPGVTGCSPSDCPNNLMCLPVGGRTLTPEQCSGFTNGLGWADLN